MRLETEELKRLREVERRLGALEQDVREILSFKERQRDQERHEWRSMLDAATRVLTQAFSGQLEPLKPILENLHLLRGMYDELQAARDERVKRKEREEQDELRRLEAQAKADARNKRWIIVGPIVSAVLVAIIAAIFSRVR